MDNLAQHSYPQLVDYALKQAFCLIWVANVIVFSEEEKKEDPTLTNKWMTHILNEEAARSWLPIRRNPGNSLQQDLFLARSSLSQAEGNARFAQAFREGATRCSREFPIQLGDGSELWLHEDVHFEKIAPREWRLVGVFTDVTHRKLTEFHLIHEAHHDPLTKLPNRSFLFHTLTNHQGPEPRFLLFLDLDNFKAINDTQGHFIGDAVLIAVAERLHQSVGSWGYVVRLGGDEFTVLLHPGATRADAVALAEQILETIRQPLPIGSDRLHLSTSIGISEASSQEASILLRNADIAMYTAKSRGRGTIVVFDAAMEHLVRTRFELENALRLAIERNEITLEYQPIILLRSGAIVGLEGLARWSHPTLGKISPEKFIPIAEETGLITLLGFQLLQQACHSLVQWHTIHPDLSLGLNVSVAQLQSPTFAQDVLTILQQFKLPPESLVLEVTESILAEEYDQVHHQLSQLYTAGIVLTMDDFGIGYSSLSALSELPLHALKIDRSFIQRASDCLPIRAERNRALIRAITSAAQALELLVVMEGIETQEQAELAQFLGGEIGQGYYFGHPLPQDQVQAYLQNTNRGSIRGVREKLPLPLAA